MEEIIGMEELEDNIDKVKQQLTADQIEPVLLQGASVFAQAAINNAPQGPTGNLKHGIIAKTLERNNSDQPAPAIAAIDYRIAPHAHLVENGHFQTEKKGGPASRFVPPHPFFRPAYDTNKEAVLEAITEDLKTMIEEAPE